MNVTTEEIKGIPPGVLQLSHVRTAQRFALRGLLSLLSRSLDFPMVS
jgi:hypothetical protein